MTPYNLWLPAWDTTSGGIRVLYGLLGYLLSKGQIVLTNAPVIDTIAIYPEIVHGNPFNAKKVVRYILATPGVMGIGGVPGPVTFAPTESLYVFSELYNTYGVSSRRILFLPILDLHTFRVTNTGKRTRKCKLVGKGVDGHLPQTEGLFELTRLFSANQQALADYLNECEVMYSYDNNSAMFEIARLCGCRVVIIPSMYTKDQFSKYEPGLNGISYGLEENAPLDPDGFRTHYQELRAIFARKIDNFIKDTQHGTD